MGKCKLAGQKLDGPNGLTAAGNTPFWMVKDTSAGKVEYQWMGGSKAACDLASTADPAHPSNPCTYIENPNPTAGGKCVRKDKDDSKDYEIDTSTFNSHRGA